MNLYSVECPVGFQTWNMLNATRTPVIRPSRFELEYLIKDEVLLFQRISTQLHFKECLGEYICLNYNGMIECSDNSLLCHLH